MKSLFKTLFAVLLTVSISNVFAQTQDRHVSGFNAVNVGGSFDVYITQGANESVKVEAPKDVIDRIKTEVENGVLKIYTKKDGWDWGNWMGNHKKMVVYVTARDLNAISLSGSGDVFFKGGIHANSLKVNLAGSGDITGKVDVSNLESSIAGSGDMRLSGRANTSAVRVSGSGDFTARDLVTNSTTIHVAGSGDAEINANDRIEASVVGSGDIRYTGAAKQISSSKTGSGDIHRM